jgi:hypothetical protein
MTKTRLFFVKKAYFLLKKAKAETAKIPDLGFVKKLKIKYLGAAKGKLDGFKKKSFEPVQVTFYTFRISKKTSTPTIIFL